MKISKKKKKKKHNEENDKGYFLEVDVQYFGKLHDLHNDLPFLPKRKNIENVKKLVANLYDKAESKTSLKQALNQRLVLRKVYRVIKFNKSAWLKQYIDMNTDLRKKKAKNYFEKTNVFNCSIVQFLEKLFKM